MNQVEQGLFAVEDTMPCNPCDIRIGRYALPSTLQRSEREEAAARILSFSQQLDRWVGVSWPRLGQMMQEEYEQYKKSNAAKEHNREEERRFHVATRKHRILCVLTLGIYTKFVSNPSKQLQEVPEFRMPFSGIFLFGPNHVTEGIRELIDQGMLKLVQKGDGDDAMDIFYPTPTLISTIMQKQGVAVG